MQTERGEPTEIIMIEYYYRSDMLSPCKKSKLERPNRLLRSRIFTVNTPRSGMMRVRDSVYTISIDQ